MRKRLAMLIVWLFFAGIMLGQSAKNPSPKSQPTKQEQPALHSSNGENSQTKVGNNETTHNGIAPDRNPSIEWPRWMRDSNWWLVIIAGLTGCVIGCQSWQTKNAAKCALLNIQAFINSERPWIQVITEPQNDKSEFKHNMWVVKAVNRGKTPAAIISDSWGFNLILVELSPPENPDYKKSDEYKAPKVLLPGESLVLRPLSRHHLGLTFGSEQCTCFDHSELNAFIFGVVRYRDVLGNAALSPIHETGWCCYCTTEGERKGIIISDSSIEGYTKHT
jgi:hypothetical protein